MTDDDWTGRIAGERMTVDKQFTDRVEASSFSSQQWGLVMTAVEFDIEGPEDPETATLVADTSKLPSIMPELDKVDQGGPMGGSGPSDDGGSGGLLDGVKSALGLGGGSGDGDRTEEAEQLAQAYADELQEELQANGRWGSVCEQADG
ncbi:DUF5799 family protein [Haloarcula laminariae]|uniref:DUF5799 family protein n=1 Tax=Haloarcula laminariae TaxID=2961577 RepID=UPI0021CA4BFB|nr:MULTISPECIES: DUF5799 family protein [Halomicroarcula]